MRVVEHEGMGGVEQQALKIGGVDETVCDPLRLSERVVQILLLQPLNPLVKINFSIVPKYEC